jgi:amino acid permease
MRPGSVTSSIFTIVILCLGSGTLTIPYVVYANGLYVGAALVLLGAGLSYYSGMLIAECAEHFGARRYEDIAMKVYGRKVAWFTSFMMLITMLGFAVAYIVLLKELLPLTLDQLIQRKLPTIISTSSTGQLFWALMFSFGVVFPISLPRSLSALRYTSGFSFCCGLYVVLAIIGVCLFNRDLNPNLKESIDATLTNTSMSAVGFLNSFPLIIFSFMYQPNIPAVFSELNQKTLPEISSILSKASLIAIAVFLLSGFFGYATFAGYNNQSQLMNLQNILKAPYEGNIWIMLAQFLLLTGIILATPLCILPCKDTVEELILGQTRSMS